MPLSDNTLIRDGLRQLQSRLPAGWTLAEPLPTPSASLGDASVELGAPDGRTAVLTVEAKARLDPRGVRALVDTLRPQLPGNPIVMTRYLSEGTRTQLRDSGFGYLDLTGNIRITVNEPGLYIETQGASEDPDRAERPARSLRGAKAGRIVRALIDYSQPPGVRELAALTNIDASYVSRVLAMLDSEALVTRVGRGRMERVDWPALLRRWAQEAPLESRGQTQTYLEPRGLPALVSRLAKSSERYAITGSIAAAQFAPLAPARLATIWIRDAEQAASKLGVRPAESGANTLLIEPTDDLVFENAAQREGVWYAAPSQVAADLLSSPGRGPAEGEELIAWMQANEGKWRL
jgi:hypothetical protein